MVGEFQNCPFDNIQMSAIERYSLAVPRYKNTWCVLYPLLILVEVYIYIIPYLGGCVGSIHVGKHQLETERCC